MFPNFPGELISNGKHSLIFLWQLEHCVRLANLEHKVDGIAMSMLPKLLDKLKTGLLIGGFLHGVCSRAG